MPKKEIQEKTGLQPPELHNFQFRLRGHDQDIWVGEWMETTEEKAFTRARKACKRMELPGWTLTCVTTGTSLPLVKLIGERDPQELAPYAPSKGRKVSKFV